MKTRLFFSLLLVMFATAVMAQAPAGFTYQAVVRNATGHLVANKQVSVSISLVSGSATGTEVYSEIHHPYTNANGLFTIVVGNGDPMPGATATQTVFSAIDWSNGPYYLVSRTDPEGGEDLSLVASQQLMSVPYALYAATADFEMLQNKPFIPTVPTNVSAFVNDAGYLTAESFYETQTLELSGDTLRLINHDTFVPFNDQYIILPYSRQSGVDTTVYLYIDSVVALIYDTVRSLDSTLQAQGRLLGTALDTMRFNYAKVEQHDTALANTMLSTLANRTALQQHDSIIADAFDSIQADRTAIADAVDSIQANRSAIADAVDSIQANRSAIAVAVDSIQANRSAIAVAADSIQANRSAIAVAVDSIQANRSAIADAADSIQANRSAIADAVDSIQANRTAIADAVDSIQANRTAIADAVDSIQANRTAIADAVDSIQANRTALQQHGATLADHADSIAQNAATLATHSTRLDSHADSISHNANRLQQHDTTLAAHADSLYTHDTIIANILDRINGYDTTHLQPLAGVLTIGNAANEQIKGLLDPTDSTDAVNLRYMQQYVSTLLGIVTNHIDSIEQYIPIYVDTTATACDSFLWHGAIYTASTERATYRSVTASGRDSITRLNLTILHGNNHADTFASELAYTWTKTSLVYEHTGTYTSAAYIDPVNGCTAVDTLHFTRIGEVVSDPDPVDPDPDPTPEVKDTVHHYDTITVVRGFMHNSTKLVAAGTYDFCDTFNVTPLHDSISHLHYIVNAADKVGVLPGTFTVGAGVEVCFAQGNLQYAAKSNTWRFAAAQYDIIGANNKSKSDSYAGYIDLFGWATSGYDNTTADPLATNFKPTATAYSKVGDNNYYGYGPSITMTDRDLVGTSANYDWGVYNTISNGGSKGDWRTLSKDEWNYLLTSRTNASKLHGLATIGTTNGVVFLPDGWSLPAGCSFTPGSSSYASNVYTLDQWAKLEAAGAVFLPAAGYCRGTSVSSVGSYGYYWTTTASTSKPSTNAHYLSFYPGYTNVYEGGRQIGLSVRLVRDGSAAKVASCLTTYGNDTVEAPIGFTLNGTTYDMPGTDNTTYTIENIGGCDSIVTLTINIIAGGLFTDGTIPGAFSVSASTTVQFSQGNLLYSAATGTWNFADNQWDTIGSANKNISASYAGNIDLFGWGTSGYNSSADYYDNNTLPYSTGSTKISGTENYYGFGPSSTSYPFTLTSSYAKYDWGVNNAISNGGNTAGTWRALSQDEWNYLLGSSSKRNGKYALATVNGIKGLVVLPDSWTQPAATTFTAGAAAGYATNTYDALAWLRLESAGAVFLPAAGVRDELKTINSTNATGSYWTTTAKDARYAYTMQVTASGIDAANESQRNEGHAVRLVK